MAKFPIVRTERTISGRGPSVRAAIDVRTGGQELAQAVSGLGEAIQNDSIRYDLIEADTQFSEARRKSREEINRLSLSFNTNFDPATFQNEYKKAEAKIRGLAPKNRRAAQTFNHWLQDRTPEWQLGVEKSKLKRVADNFRMEGFNLKVQAEQTGDIEAYKIHLAKGKKLGVYGAEEAAKLAEAAVRDAPYYQARAELDGMIPISEVDDPLALFDITDLTIDEVLKAMDFDRFENLTPKHKALLRSDAKTIANDRIKQAKAKLANIQEQTDINFFARYGIDLKPSDIAMAVSEHRLGREAGDRWLNRLADPRDYPTDPATEARILRDLADPGKRIIESDVLDLIGKPDGLSTATARRFISDMDIFKDPWFKRIDMFLKSQLGWDGAYEKFIHPEGGISYKQASDELFKAIETKKLKGREIYDEGTLIAIPFVVSYWENVLMLDRPAIERMKAMLLKGKLIPVKVEPKTKEPAKPKPVEKRDVIDPEGIF